MKIVFGARASLAPVPGLWGMQRAMATIWGSAAAIRTALGKTRSPGEAFFEGLSAFSASHLKALSALSDDELIKLGSSEVGVRSLGWVLENALTDAPKLAVRLGYAITTPRNAKKLYFRTASAALMGVVLDPVVDPAHLQQAIDAATPFGKQSPDIFINAALCAAAFTDWKQAYALLKKARAAKVKGFKKVRSHERFVPVAKDPKFVALF